MRAEELNQAVIELNEKVHENKQSTYFSYLTNGDIDIIQYDSIVLWCSEEHENFETISELVTFVRSELRELINNLKKLL